MRKHSFNNEKPWEKRIWTNAAAATNVYTQSVKLQYRYITSRAIRHFKAKNSGFMTMFMHLMHQVQVKMDDSHWAAYIIESWIKIYIIWVIKQSLELTPSHFDCINIWFSLPHLLNSPISGPRASRLGPHIGQCTAYSNGEPRVSWQLSGWISGGSGSRVRSGRTQTQSEAQICAAEETKCAVRGPLVPSRWGGLQYNGGCQTNSSGQQRTAWHHFLPLTRGPNPAGIFQVPHSSNSQAFTSRQVGQSKADTAGHKLNGDVLMEEDGAHLNL